LIGVATISAAAGGVALVTGAVTVDLNVGRTTRRLGPVDVRIGAPPEMVFDLIASPYLGKTPRAMQNKLKVLERGSDMVLAAHFTPIGMGLRTTTIETVRFERPQRVTFRLVRGPVPYVVEAFDLAAVDRATELRYSGEMSADLWAAGRWWVNVVSRTWEQTVRNTLASLQAEAERRARPRF
jgi:hypothetical protein